MKKTIQIFRIGTAALFILIALVPTTIVAEIYTPTPSHVETTEEEIMPAILLMKRVRIISLRLTEFPPEGYIDCKICWMIENFEEYDVTVQIENTLILPDGKSTTFSGIFVIPEGESLGTIILYKYTTDLYGKYTYILTVKNTFEDILDTKSVTWERT